MLFVGGNGFQYFKGAVAEFVHFGAGVRHATMDGNEFNHIGNFLFVVHIASHEFFDFFHIAGGSFGEGVNDGEG